jgi:hypothetical protein
MSFCRSKCITRNFVLVHPKATPPRIPMRLNLAAGERTDPYREKEIAEKQDRTEVCTLDSQYSVYLL